MSGDVLNNLPAALVTLPHVTHTAAVWPLLFGLNAGPILVITGSLAGLLWQASARASGVHVTGRAVLPHRRARGRAGDGRSGLIVLGLH